jgi:hypothetical protein
MSDTIDIPYTRSDQHSNPEDIQRFVDGLTQADIDAIDINDPAYQAYFAQRMSQIQSVLLVPIAQEQIDNRIKTQWLLTRNGFCLE